MYNLNDFLLKLEEYAPLNLSKLMIERGGYDNSGLLIESEAVVKGALFTLDLSEEAVNKAKRLGLNTIVTHHPAIYNPISNLSVEDKSTSAVVKAIKEGINVISMHLNLDVCTNGIDAWLCEGLGGAEYKIIDYVDEQHGYGREFKLSLTLGKFVSQVKQRFGTKKIISYGSKNKTLKCGASFCGAGGHDALSYVNGCGIADVIITSDVSHHVIKAIIENGKSLVILPHYVAEEYGFNKFYEWAKEQFGSLPISYYADKRFK